MSGNNLFSIDVDAHLKKAASYTFGSSSHYPVELVRAALQRGASQVDVTITGDRLQVRDNGKGLDSAAIATLIALMDPRHADLQKEEAVESMQTQQGMGLLAIFASNPGEIQVDNVSVDGKIRLYLKNQFFKTSHSFASAGIGGSSGTYISLNSNHRDAQREKQLLEAFCRSVQQDVLLNGRPIGKQPFLSSQMATIELSFSSTVALSFGQVGVPGTGRTCHFRLLDQGIPWHHFSLPPQQGFIFDAAVETAGGVTQDLIEYLVQFAHRLYQWLGQRYTSTEPLYQDRIEELLFTHCRLTGDDSLILNFAPFRVFNSRGSLSLRQVKEIAARGSLYAVPRHKDYLRYNTAHKTVLSLTREQADLLINHLNIPVTFLNPVVHRGNPLPFFWYALKRKFKRLIIGLLPTPKNILRENQLTKAQKLFVFVLTRHLTGKGEFSLFYRPGIEVRMIPSRGVFPAVVSKRNKQIFVRRDHPLVKKAIQAVQADPKNIELFIPLIVANAGQGGFL